MESTNPKKQLVFGIALVLGGLVIGLLIIEVVFRLSLGRQQDKNHSSDRPKLYYFSEKAQNNRDYYYDREKPADTYRIVVIGDSFTYGYGIQFDDAFPKRLERLLNLNENQQKVEVLNFGIPGYSTRDEVQTVRQVLRDYHPDLIVLEITLNDPEINEYVPHDKLRNKQGGIVLKGGIWDYWKSLAYVAARIKNTASREEYKRYFQDLFTNPQTLQNFRVSLRDIEEQCKTANVKLTATIFPLLSFPLDDTYPFPHAHEVTREIMSSLQVPTLDLFESFRGLSPERLQSQVSLDPHPNEIAHRIAAESLYAFLKNQKLIPEEAIVRYTAKKRLGPSKLTRSRGR